MAIKVAVNGAQGKMGKETVLAINRDPELSLVAALSRQDNLAQALEETKPDLVIDFTTPETVFENAQIIIDAGIHPVIGTTGLTPEQITFLQTQCRGQQLGGIIAPNFSLGAVLLMKMARMAAAFMPDAEIIELHHPHKKDAPSGTALKTAEMIAGGRTEPHHICNPTESKSRGFVHQQVPIHSIRLPGLVAHESVIFGGHMETLTITHDSLHRESFMPGVILACKKVMHLKALVYGLEHVI